jgi:hypothetical protein
LSISLSHWVVGHVLDGIGRRPALLIYRRVQIEGRGVTIVNRFAWKVALHLLGSKEQQWRNLTKGMFVVMVI